MSTHKNLAALVLALAFTAAPAFAENTGLGKPISEADIKNWDIAILPDGSNLPPGRGTPQEGAKVFAEKCAMCHGDQAKGGVMPFYPALVGGAPLTNGIETQKTIANYYAYATTVFDYVRRAMPLTAPRSLTDSQYYAVTAYLLQREGIIAPGTVMDAKSLPAVQMPGRSHFVVDDRTGNPGGKSVR